MQPSFIQRYLVPGIVFQSVIVAGGYGTGRELVEFFLSLGLKGGILALLCTALVWSGMCALTFEFARQFQAYDYRKFFVKLLGRFWFLFEWSYIAVLLIVLSIVVSSAGSIIQEEVGLSYNIGVLGLTLYVCFMLLKGNCAIEKTLSFWTVMLYGVFATIFLVILSKFGTAISAQYAQSSCDNPTGSLYQGIRYAGYNLGLIPAVLFTIRNLTCRREAVTAGLLSGIIAIIPALFIFTSLFCATPEIASATVPTVLLLEKLDIPLLFLLYNIVMLMTLVETSIGLIHAFNERIVNSLQKTTPYLRLYVGGVVLLVSALIAQLGLVELISKGYGILTWVIIDVYLIPLVTIGIYKLGKQHAHVQQTV